MCACMNSVVLVVVNDECGCLQAIETHIGAVLTISTMGCAAIGNLISDVAGLIHTYVQTCIYMNKYVCMYM